MAGIHDGHRERLRNKIKRFGFDCLEEHEKLEYLLYSFIPRRDTNPIAHELIATFGSFRKVLDADPALLLRVKGMTENAALFLHCLPEVFITYAISEKPRRYSASTQFVEEIVARIGRRTDEHFLVYYIDELGRIARMDEINSDSARVVRIDRDKLVSDAVRYRAKYVVIGHNHPGGTPEPSSFDVEATNRIVQALGMVGIELEDHIVVSEGEYYSMKERGDLIKPVNLNGANSLHEFAQSLIRRENNIRRMSAKDIKNLVE